MRRALAAIVVCFVTGVAMVAACGRPQVEVATIEDGGAPCSTLDGGQSCLPGFFCSSTSCGSATGRCESARTGESCAEPYDPQCGCDGLTYFNPCLRQVARQSEATGGGVCPFNNTPHSCSATKPCAGSQVCALVFPSGSLVPATSDGGLDPMACTAFEQFISFFPLGVCWVLPESGSCPDSGATLRSCDGQCTNACPAIRTPTGFLSDSCPAPGASDD